MEKTFTDGFRQIDTKLGQYMTLGGLVIDLGGWSWPPAVAGAKTIAYKCARMGGKWAQIDEQSEMPMYLRLKTEHREHMDKSWQTFTKWHNGRDNNGVEAPAITDDKDGQPPAKKARGAALAGTQEKPGKAPKAKAKAKSKADPASKNSPGKSTDGSLKQMLSKAASHKALYSKVMGKADTLVLSIDSDDNWDWARVDQHRKAFTQLLEEVRSKQSAFASEFMTLDLKMVRERYADARLNELLKAFTAEMSYTKVLKAHTKLLQLHAIELKSK